MPKIYFLRLVFFITSLHSFAQVEIVVDTSRIKIGEQIKYEIRVNTDQNVNFSKFKTDSLQRIEIIKEFSIDTLKNRLVKKYLLTSFDSGTYIIPRQDVTINGTHYFTDSLLIHVGTVEVDTTKQGLFPIKPIYKAPPKTWHDYRYLVWWILGLLLLLGLIWWLAFRSKKVIQWKQKVVLSPFEEAIKQLQTLDDKNLIQNQRIKEYYTELTDIIRVYMEKDLNIAAMELTSDELITLFKKTNKYKKLGIARKQLENLQIFLRNADLVKFAKAIPEHHEIREDRKHAEELLKEIKLVANRPQLDENGQTISLMAPEEVLLKTRRKRRVMGVGIGLGILILLLAGSIWYYGYQYVKDTLLGHPTKELLEGKWYKANYGYPSVSLEAPVILKLIQNQSGNMITTSNSIFEYHNLLNHLKIKVNTISYTEDIPITLEKAAEIAIQTIANQKGVKAVSLNQKKITVSGKEAIQIFGTFEAVSIKVELNEIIMFNGKNFADILFLNKQDDIYAKKIRERVLSSIQWNNIYENQ